MKYKKYIVFEIEQYYPSVGLNDIVISFDTIEEVKGYLKDKNYDYSYHSVIDRDTWEEADV